MCLINLCGFLCRIQIDVFPGALRDPGRVGASLGQDPYVLICCCQVSTRIAFCPQSGGRGSSAVERATPGEEVLGSIPAVAALSLLVGSVSV